MFRSMICSFAVFTMFASSAFATSTIHCRYNNIPNGSWPDNGAIRNDMIKISGIDTNAPQAYWTPFVDTSSSSEPLIVTKVQAFRCPNCYDVYAQTLGGSYVIFFKIHIEQDTLSDEIRSDFWFRQDVGGPTDWVQMNEEAGICLTNGGRQ
jgi:hypothetical protein